MYLNEIPNTLEFNHKHAQLLDNNLETLSEDAIFEIDTQKIVHRYHLLQSLLPNVHHYFAIKACPVIEFLKPLHEIGAYFDLASNGEIKVLESLRFDFQKSIHTHPIKKQSEIEYAISKGIKTFVVDNFSELFKFENYKKEVQILLRLSFENETAAINLSSKFGIISSKAVAFVEQAYALKYNIKGLSFHVGSQSKNNSAYLSAIQTCKTIFDQLSSKEIHLRILDIGGGFPYFIDESEADLKAFFNPIKHLLEEHFSNTYLISEPGRFLATPCAKLITQIIGKSKKNQTRRYYLNDGLYGTLSKKIFDLMEDMDIVLAEEKATQERFHSILFGNTCDSLDTIEAEIMLPELSIGDSIIFNNVGAYSIASASDFNLLGKALIKTV